jgi:hypothetical protein
MHHLVNEIQDIICTYFSRDDLRSLRLCCKATLKSATALLFQTIDILPFGESFRWIGENEQIREYVRCVRYISKLLPKISDYSDYPDRISVGLDDSARKAFFAKSKKSQVRGYWRMFRWYRESQFLILEEGVELELLATLFSNLPRL